jgi:DNA-binding LytR/AlgR family response regulator
MSGLELARRIQETDPDLPMILASGYAEIVDPADSDVLPRLAKPFRQADLSAAIAGVVEDGSKARRNVVPLRIPKA